MTRLWAGLDIGSETTSICVIDDTGNVVREGECSTDLRCVRREIASFRRRRSLNIGMEAGVGIHLARGLRDLGYSVEIYEARQLSKFLRLRRNKTDAGDANGIAQAGRLAAPMVSKVFLKPIDCQELASRLAIRRHLIRARAAAFRVLCCHVELFGGRLPRRVQTASFHANAEAQLKKLFGLAPSPLASQLFELLAHCEALVEQQRALDLDLNAEAQANPVCRRLMAVPGVGPICALTFYAAIGDPFRFRHAADVGSYFGLTPRLKQSGFSRKTGRISRMGHRYARGLLVQASMHFMRSADPHLALHAWASAIALRRGRGKSRVALARKLATIMVAMWKKDEPFRPQLLEGVA